MVNYRCNKCKQPTETSECPICHERTFAESKLYWCSNCNIPLYEDKCSLCGEEAGYVATDLRPVFPEERLLIEIVLNSPFAFLEKSVWNSKGMYYVDGKRISFSLKTLEQIDVNKIQDLYYELLKSNTYNQFNSMIEKYIKANSERYIEVVNEAVSYIQNVSDGTDFGSMFVSFSGVMFR